MIPAVDVDAAEVIKKTTGEATEEKGKEHMLPPADIALAAMRAVDASLCEVIQGTGKVLMPSALDGSTAADNMTANNNAAQVTTAQVAGGEKAVRVAEYKGKDQVISVKTADDYAGKAKEASDGEGSEPAAVVPAASDEIPGGSITGKDDGTATSSQLQGNKLEFRQCARKRPAAFVEGGSLASLTDHSFADDVTSSRSDGVSSTGTTKKRRISGKASSNREVHPMAFVSIADWSLKNEGSPVDILNHLLAELRATSELAAMAAAVGLQLPSAMPDNLPIDTALEVVDTIVSSKFKAAGVKHTVYAGAARRHDNVFFSVSCMFAEPTRSCK